MSADALVALLDRDDLAKVEDEVKVLDLAMKWLKFDHKDVDVENRHKYTKKVLKKVHLGLVTQSHLMVLLSELNEVPESAAWVEEVLKLQDSKSDVTVPLSMTHPHWFSPRNEMVVNTLIGIGPYAKSGGQRLVYFNSYGPKKSLGWQHWCGFKDIPHDIPVYDSSVVSINGKLYVAGGICKPGRREYRFLPAPRYVYKWNSWCFHEGNVAEDPMKFGEDQEFATVDITNPWTTLPELKTVRNSFPMVHLDGYLYAIGGEDEDYNAINQVEGYSFRDKKWEKLADLPVPCYYACATVYKGNILVYGSQQVPDSDTAAQHDLQMYDPATNQWTNLLTEHHKIEKFKKIITKEENASYIKPRRDMDDEEYDSEAQTTDMLDDAKNKERGRLLPRNALIVDDEDCFRVVYPATESSMKRPPPVVHKLEFGYNGTVPECYVGERLDQSLMPTTGEGAFQIRGRVHINMRGAVFDANIKIFSDQKMEVDLSVWKKLLAEDYLGDLTFTNLTFDKKKVFCKSCVRGKHCTNHFSIFDDADVLMKMAESDEDSD